MVFDAKWRAVQRETQLAATLIARGVTALGNASHATPGLYAEAFFGLSIGLERVGKLIYIADFAMANAGRFPTDDDLRKIGHDVESLIKECEAVASKLDANRLFATKPNDQIHDAIVRVLSEFGKRTRYYNLRYLAGAAGGIDDPIAMWWSVVAQPILAKHYTLKKRSRDIARAGSLESVLGPISTVMHSDEMGNPINSIADLFGRAEATRVVQKYGRLYVLQIVRWLGSMVNTLALSGYHRDTPFLLGLDDAFDVFMNDDAYLRDRKTWSPYN